MSREQDELNDELWTTVDDVSPAQRAYEETLPEPKPTEGKPF
jgi:hypothetical protein